MQIHTDAKMNIKKNLDAIIFERLKDEIIAGTWKQGQQILIDELAEHFGVSRTPVIQAARMMSVDGMFSFKKNGRIEIPVFERQQVVDVYEMRLLLEDYALKTICSRKMKLPKSELDAVAKECVYQQNVLHDAVASRRADLKLHGMIVAATGNECLISSYLKVQGQFMVANYLLISHSEKLQSIAADQHFTILDHLYQYDYEGAKNALEQHIMNGCRRVVDRIEESAE